MSFKSLSEKVSDVRTEGIEGVNLITIAAVSHDIYIMATDENEVKAVFEGEAGRGIYVPKLVVDRAGSEINIKIKYPHVFLGLGMIHDNRVLTVYVPKTYSEEVFIENVSGKVEASNMNLSRISVKEVSGRIRLSNVTSRNSKFKTVSSDIRVDKFSGEVDFNTVSGSIEAEYVELNNNISMHTVSGNLMLRLPQDSSFTLEASTVSGYVDCDFETQNHSNSRTHTRLVCGSGEHNIKVNSVSGNVRITK